MTELNRNDAIQADKITIFKWLRNKTTFEEMWDIFKNKIFFNLIQFNYFWKCSKLSIDPISISVFGIQDILLEIWMIQELRIENNSA